MSNSAWHHGISGSKRGLGETLTFDQFLLRSRVLDLYRTILRGIQKIPDPQTQAESKKYVREGFEQHRHVKEADHIRYLLSAGKAEWESAERYIGGGI